MKPIARTYVLFGVVSVGINIEKSAFVWELGYCASIRICAAKFRIDNSMRTKATRAILRRTLFGHANCTLNVRTPTLF